MEIVEKLKELLIPILEEMQIELVELSFHGSRNHRLLRIFVDTEAGVTIDECKKASHAIADVLDMEDIIQDRYHLEVSSPGLDRPLKTERDFKRNLGRELSLIVQEGDVTRTLKGIVEKVAAGKVQIQSGKVAEEIPIQSIQNAKIVLKW